MYTRKDYMDHKVSFEDYYRQFVLPETLSSVFRVIPPERILQSKDENLNDIDMSLWDALSGYGYTQRTPLLTFARIKLRESEDAVYFSSLVCIAKVAALDWKSQQNE